MTGRWLVRQAVPEPPHRCYPPTAGPPPSNADGRPGDVWQCECGRAWIVTQIYGWRKLSRRRTRRLTRAAQ